MPKEVHDKMYRKVCHERGIVGRMSARKGLAFPTYGCSCTLLNIDALYSKKVAQCSLQADAVPPLRSVGAGRQEKCRSSFEGQVHLRVIPFLQQFF